MKIDAQLDISTVKCPMTFVKTKLFMEKMAVGQCVEIFLTGEEAVTNLPQTLRLEGHTVVDLSPVKGGRAGLYRLVVETGSTCAD